MKKILIASIALASAGAYAQSSGFDGFVSAAAGTNKISTSVDPENSYSSNSGTSNLRGTFSFTHATGFGVQVDNVVDNQNIIMAKIRTNDTAFHGFYRQDNYLIGAIYQTRTFKAKAEGMTSTLPVDRAFTGFEGQYDFGDISVYGLTARDTISMYDTEFKGRTNSLEARYFFNDNLRTDFTYATSNFSEFETSSKSKTKSVGVEYKFNDSPFSAFAKYQDIGGTFVDTKRFFVGVTLSFGKESLKARNASGASLNPISVDNQLLNAFGGF